MLKIIYKTKNCILIKYNNKDEKDKNKIANIGLGDDVSQIAISSEGLMFVVGNVHNILNYIKNN